MLSKAESILLWSSNLWALGMGMLGPLYAVFADKVGGDVFELSWVYAVYLAVTGLGVIVVGKLADNWGYGKLIVIGNGIGTLATFGFLLVSSIPGLLLVQILVGVSTALSEPSWYALYDKHSGDGSNDGYIWGLASGLWYIFRAIAMLVGGYIVATYSFDILFIVMGTVLAVSTVYQAQILRYKPC